MTNTMAGRNIAMLWALAYTKSRTKYLAPRESVMLFRDHVKVRIRMAGTLPAIITMVNRA